MSRPEPAISREQVRQAIGLTVEELRGRLTRPLSVVETAATLGVSKDTVYEAAARGELRSWRLGRRVLIPAVVVLEELGLDAGVPDPEA